MVSLRLLALNGSKLSVSLVLSPVFIFVIFVYLVKDKSITREYYCELLSLFVVEKTALSLSFCISLSLSLSHCLSRSLLFSLSIAHLMSIPENILFYKYKNLLLFYFALSQCQFSRTYHLPNLKIYDYFISLSPSTSIVHFFSFFLTISLHPY